MYDREELASLIGRNIRTLRGRLTQKDFGENVGILQGPISRYEKGLEIPGIQALMKIAAGASTKTQGYSVNDLIYFEIKSDTPTAPKPLKTAPKPVKVKAVKKTTVPKPSKTAAKAQVRAAALDAPDVKPKRKNHKPSVVSLQVEVKND